MYSDSMIEPSNTTFWVQISMGWDGIFRFYVLYFCTGLGLIRTDEDDMRQWASPTGDRTRVACTGGRSSNHCTTKAG